MRNADKWLPTKFVLTSAGLNASPDSRHVAKWSRVTVDLIARAYYGAIRGHAGGILADVGCGRVPLYQTYVDLVNEIICIDWEKSLHADDHVDLAADLNEAIPLPSQHVDTVVATDVLEHLFNPDRFWSEVSRILRPGGKLILGVPFLYWIHEEPHDHARYTRHRLVRFCVDHGLEVLSLEAYGGPVAVSFDIAAKNAPSFMVPSINWVASRALRSGAIARLDQRQSYLFPLGYCLVARKTA